jgi:hypothetical protein
MSDTDPRAAERHLVDETDFGDVDLEEAVGVEIDRRVQPRSTFAIRLDGETIDALREVASRYKTRPTQLAREWIIERLRHERDVVATQVVVAFPSVRAHGLATAVRIETEATERLKLRQEV